MRPHHLLSQTGSGLLNAFRYLELLLDSSDDFIDPNSNAPYSPRTHRVISANDELFLGYDSRLRRSVWIHKLPDTQAQPNRQKRGDNK